MDIKIFLLVYILQIILTLPDFINTCSKLDLQTWTIYLTHHAFDVFVFWAPLFLKTRAEYLIHIVVVLLTVLHWLMNNNTCIITVILNRLCGYREDDWLPSLKNMLGLRALSENFHFIWVGGIVAWELFTLSG